MITFREELNLLGYNRKIFYQEPNGSISFVFGTLTYESYNYKYRLEYTWKQEVAESTRLLEVLRHLRESIRHLQIFEKAVFDPNLGGNLAPVGTIERNTHIKRCKFPLNPDNKEPYDGQKYLIIGGEAYINWASSSVPNDMVVAVWDGVNWEAGRSSEESVIIRNPEYWSSMG